MSNLKPYHVTVIIPIGKNDDGTTTYKDVERLIYAKSRNAAFLHAARDSIEVRLATVDAALRLAKSGVEAEYPK